MGIAGTVEVYVAKDPKTKEDTFLGYKGALYLSVGLSGIGLLTSALFIVKSQMRSKREKLNHYNKPEKETVSGW